MGQGSHALPVNVEQQERAEKTICLRMCLDKLAVQTIVLANLVFAAHVQVVAELFDVDRIVEVLVLEMVHVLASGSVEPDNGLPGVRSCDVQRVDCEIEAIGIVDAGIGPHFVETSLPHIHTKLELLCVMGDLFTKTVGNTHTLRVCVLIERIISSYDVDATIG